jgi:hypothetical protein
MRSRRAILLVLAVAVELVSACSDPSGGPGGDDGGPADSGGVDATLPDASRTDAALTSDAGDSGSDSGSDSDADADADADSGSDSGSDAADSSVDANDGGDAGARWVVTQCVASAASAFTALTIDSAGNMYFRFPSPQAGSPIFDPPSTTQLDAAQLAALLSAARALDVSDAGTTTTTTAATYTNAHTGQLHSAGALGGTPILVRSLEDGVAFGHRMVVVTNDPAAAPILQNYDCFLTF